MKELSTYIHSTQSAHVQNEKEPRHLISNPFKCEKVCESSWTPAAVLNLRLTLSQQAPSSTNSHQNSKTREILSPDPTSHRDNRSRLETEGAREREKGGGWRGQSTGGRVSERKGQTPQQQAWETLLMSREKENSHHTAEWARLVVSRDWCGALRMDVLQCWNSVYPLINNLHRRNWQDILTLKLEISQAPVW